MDSGEMGSVHFEHDLEKKFDKYVADQTARSVVFGKKFAALEQAVAALQSAVAGLGHAHTLGVAKDVPYEVSHFPDTSIRRVD